MPDEPRILILGPRTGRPRVEPGEKMASVSSWIPARDYDRLAAIARQRDSSVAAVVRDLIRQGRRGR